MSKAFKLERQPRISDTNSNTFIESANGEDLIIEVGAFDPDRQDELALLLTAAPALLAVAKAAKALMLDIESYSGVEMDTEGGNRALFDQARAAIASATKAG